MALSLPNRDPESPRICTPIWPGHPFPSFFCFVLGHFLPPRPSPSHSGRRFCVSTLSISHSRLPGEPGREEDCERAGLAFRRILPPSASIYLPLPRLTVLPTLRLGEQGMVEHCLAAIEPCLTQEEEKFLPPRGPCAAEPPPFPATIPRRSLWRSRIQCSPTRPWRASKSSRFTSAKALIPFETNPSWTAQSRTRTFKYLSQG